MVGGGSPLGLTIKKLGIKFDAREGAGADIFVQGKFWREKLCGRRGSVNTEHK